jgi:uncharacterized membrane protein
MATMTVWKYDDAAGAERAKDTLAELQKEGLIQIVDAAIVEWDPSRKKPKTRQLHNLTAAGALSGSFWGLLFGLIFFVPLLGMVVGAATGALSGSLSDVGIDDDFIRRTRDAITPGTSALFLLSQEAVVDKVAERVPRDGELIHTNLNSEEEQALREVFAAE